MNNNEIVEIIEANDNLITYKDYQVIIEKKLRDKIYNFVDKIKDEDIDIKESIKSSIRKALKLKSNDIIIIKKDQIFIKIFNEKKIHKVAPKDKDTIANRFNGIDEDELDDFYDEYFPKKESKIFFQTVVREFIELYFLDEKIDNNRYEKKVFSYIQSIIMEKLIEEFDYCDEFFKGFSGYIFRKHFNEVFEYIADFMLNEISISNEYIIEFLKYYSYNIVIINGEKYRVPALETDDGLKWNVISMLSIAKIYTRTRESIKRRNKEIDVLDEEALGLFIDELSPVEYNNLYIKERQELEEELSKENRKLEKFLDSIYITKDKKKKDSLKKDAEQIKKEIKLIKQDMRELAKEEIKRSVVDKYLKIERELDSMLRALKAEERILAQNEKAFLSIKKALVKALISKKQRI